MASTRETPSTPASSTGTEKGYLLYLYCVFERDTPGRRMLERGTTPGLEEGQPLFAIEAKGLAAAVSRVSADVFQEEPLNALLQDLRRLAPYAVRHEQAISALLPEVPALIPMTMGSVYRSRESVMEMLEANAQRFLMLLRRLSGKREWTLRVLRERTLFLNAVQARSPILRDLEAQASREAPGRAYLLRKQQERVLEGEAEAPLRQATGTIVEELRQVSTALHVDDLPRVEPSEVMLAFKAALLVDVQGQRAFQSAARELADRYGGQGLRVEVTGPWAPYSFVGESRDAR